MPGRGGSVEHLAQRRARSHKQPATSNQLLRLGIRCHEREPRTPVLMQRAGAERGRGAGRKELPCALLYYCLKPKVKSQTRYLVSSTHSLHGRGARRRKGIQIQRKPQETTGQGRTKQGLQSRTGCPGNWNWDLAHSFILCLAWNCHCPLPLPLRRLGTHVVHTACLLFVAFSFSGTKFQCRGPRTRCFAGQQVNGAKLPASGWRLLFEGSGTSGRR
jgi:hypothetical protein